jgi:hypothetical protein
MFQMLSIKLQTTHIDNGDKSNKEEAGIQTSGQMRFRISYISNNFKCHADI